MMYQVLSAEKNNQRGQIERVCRMFLSFAEVVFEGRSLSSVGRNTRTMSHLGPLILGPGFGGLFWFFFFP